MAYDSIDHETARHNELGRLAATVAAEGYKRARPELARLGRNHAPAEEALTAIARRIFDDFHARTVGLYPVDHVEDMASVIAGVSMAFLTIHVMLLRNLASGEGPPA